MERETGTDPASLAWKARVLPLNYSRISDPQAAFAKPSVLGRLCVSHSQIGGGGWIRTSVGVSKQIYSLPPLATQLQPQSFTRLRVQAPVAEPWIMAWQCIPVRQTHRLPHWEPPL